MAQELEPLNLKITGNANGLSAALGKAQGDISGFTSSIQGKLAAIAAVAVPSGGLGFAVKLAADAQDAELTFKSLTGSMETAKKVLADLQAFSASTPFEFTQDVKPAAQQLLTYGFSVDELKNQLTILGNVAAVSGADFTELAKLVGRARSTNLLFTEDLNQFSDRAIPVLDMLAKRFGVTGAEVRKMASEGKINFADLQAVLEALGGEGGKFASAMEERSKTLNGQISTLKDNFTLLSQSVGEALVPAANEAVQVLSKIVEWMRGLDASTVETTVKIAAFSAGFAAAVTILPKVIALGTQVVATIRAIATAQTVMQALAGPKGWATLAVGLAAAGVAVYGVDKMFESLSATQEQSAKASQAVAQGFKEVEKRSADGAASLKEFQDKANGIKTTLATPDEKYKAKLEELSQAVIKGGLDFEFFRRGVRAAYEELEKFNQQQIESSRPKFATRGSKEAREILDKRAFDAKVGSQVESEVDRLKRKIEEQKSTKPVDEMKTVLAAKLDNVATKLDGVIAAVNNNKPVVRTANI